MRVCFVSRRFFPAISGMSVYALNFLRELVRLGHDVTLISQYRGDAQGARIYGGGPPPEVPGVTVIGLESLGEQNGGDFERDIDAMVEAIREQHANAPFDVLHAQYAYPNGWAALLAARDLGVPVVVSIQGGDGHWVGSCCETHKIAIKRVISHAHALIIGGQSFLFEVAKRLNAPPDRFTIIPGAIDTSRFAPADEGAVGRMQTPPRLLYHGRVDRRKGVLDFIEALVQLRHRDIAFRAVISGIGPDLDASRDLAAARHLGPDVLTFSGGVAYDDVPSVYRDADIFASPTYAEGFSNTILEAMASGLPIASCETVGVSDCLRHDDNALLSAPGDVPDLAGNLERLILDPASRRSLASAALHDCRRLYSWPRVASEIVGVYRALNAHSHSPPLDPSLPDSPCRFRAEPHLF